MKRKRHSKKAIEQIQVLCPRKIQKAILKNMLKNAKSRLNNIARNRKATKRFRTIKSKKLRRS